VQQQQQKQPDVVGNFLNLGLTALTNWLQPPT
jgi:hypothetical protein